MSNVEILCEKCGGKIIERRQDGIWLFKFGRTKDVGESAVNIEIHGSVKITCFRKRCRHVNILNYFPPK